MACCGSYRRTGTAPFGLTRDEQDRIQSFLDELCAVIGCRRGTDVFVSAVRNTAKKHFPEADSDCLGKAIQLVVQGVAECLPLAFQPNGLAQFVSCATPKVVPGLAQFLSCLFGAERTGEISVQFLECLLQFLAKLASFACTAMNLCPTFPPGPGTPGTPPADPEGPELQEVQRC